MRRRSQFRQIFMAMLAMYCSLDAVALEHPTAGSVPDNGVVFPSTHRTTEDLRTAKVNLIREIASLDMQGDVSPTTLVEALTSLAATLNSLQEYEAAIVPARRALAIIRSRNGLYAEEQLGLLQLLVNAQSQLGRVKEAADDLSFQERIFASSDSGPARHAQMLTGIGDWYCRIGDFYAGRDRHRRAIEMLQDSSHENELLNAQLGLARCSLHELSSQGIRTSAGVFEEYRGPIVRAGSFNANNPSYRYHLTRGLRQEGESALRDAADWVVKSDTASAKTKVDTLLLAGDWFQLKGFTNTARRYYVQAAKLLDAAQKGGDQFETPVRVLYAIPPIALRGFAAPVPDRSERFLVVEFTVRADGTVQTPKVLQRNVTKSMVDETLDALRSARFRPRVVNGEPVEVRGVQLRQSFDDPRELSGGGLAYSNAE
jgi:tetratricopeptide (TPR) repeat protein